MINLDQFQQHTQYQIVSYSTNICSIEIEKCFLGICAIDSVNIFDSTNKIYTSGETSMSSSKTISSGIKIIT